MKQLTTRFGPGTVQYAIYGMLFGLTFPIMATFLEIVFQQLPFTAASIVQIHGTQPLHWIVDTSPIVLGFMAALVGNRQDRLTEVNEVLEEQVAARTSELSYANQMLKNRASQLELVAQISQQISKNLDINELTSLVVTQVQTTFEYYHAHIYLLDEETRDMVMVGGTGEAGMALLAKGHKVLKGRGLVGKAAETQEVVLVSDVTQERGWLPNPLLPDTKSEIAVPIVSGDRLLGVLDVQQDKRDGLTEEDAWLLQSVANQVAVALGNARLYEQAQKQAERETVINTIAQKIQSAPDVELVLQIASQELGKVMGAQRTTVYLGHEMTKGANGQKMQEEG